MQQQCRQRPVVASGWLRWPATRAHHFLRRALLPEGAGPQEGQADQLGRCYASGGASRRPHRRRTLTASSSKQWHQAQGWPSAPAERFGTGKAAAVRACGAAPASDAGLCNSGAQGTPGLRGGISPPLRPLHHQDKGDCRARTASGVGRAVHEGSGLRAQRRRAPAWAGQAGQQIPAQRGAREGCRP